MGGGNPPPPKTYSPQENAQAQIQIDNAAADRERAEQQRQEIAAAQERQRLEAVKQADIQRTAGDATRMYQEGGQWGQNRINNLGFADTYGLLDTYRGMLGTARSSVPQQSADVGQYFDYEDMFSRAMAQEQQAEQNMLSNQYSDRTKVGWQNDYFADTADDEILDAILGEQYGETFDTIDAARARGQLSQGGFDNTLRKLDTKKHSARATLEDLGLGVLGGYRNELTGIADQFGNKVTNYKLGQNLNLDDMTSAIGGRRDALTGRMKGDIYRAVGDTSLFSPETIMAQGGAAAGVSNSPLRNAFRDTSLDPDRTTGTTGVF